MRENALRLGEKGGSTDPTDPPLDPPLITVANMQLITIWGLSSPRAPYTRLLLTDLGLHHITTLLHTSFKSLHKVLVNSLELIEHVVDL